ncbi:mCG1034856, isoform CRA_b [Mus musculus]|nr:mCG1034856, isoform CRA_b [Mus musculus]
MSLLLILGIFHATAHTGAWLTSQNWSLTHPRTGYDNQAATTVPGVFPETPESVSCNGDCWWALTGCFFSIFSGRFITRNTLSLQEIPQPLAMTIHCHLISSTPLCARG